MLQMLTDDLVITARTVEVLDEATFVAQEERHGMLLTCPTTKGLLGLGVRSDGSIVKKFPRTLFSPIPQIGTELAIFGLTDHWVTADVWKRVSWAVNAKSKFRAYAHNRKYINGDKTTELTEELLLTGRQGSTLLELIASSTRGSSSDTFAEKYSYGIQKNGGTMYYETRWEMFDPRKGFWVRCSDPRPIGKFEFES